MSPTLPPEPGRPAEAAARRDALAGADHGGAARRDVAALERVPLDPMPLDPMPRDAVPLDIVHVVENLERGGLERMVIDLSHAQRAAGHRVRVACLFAPGALAPELSGQGVEVFACGKRSGADLGAVLRLRRWLRDGWREGGRGDRRGGRHHGEDAASAPRIVHTHNATAHYHAALACAALPAHRLLNTRHGMGAQHPRSRKEWIYRRSLTRTDAVAAVCEAARARFAAQGVRPRGVLATVPNGIRIDAFAAADEARREALRRTLGLSAQARIVGTVGRLNPVKDQAALLRAFARLRASRPDCALVLVGDGPLREPLQAEAVQLGIADAVRFLGDRGDVRALLPGFDLFALSSRSEGYSMALLEACVCALPIVATDVGGNREIVADGVNGRLVPAAAPEALAEALGAVLDAPERARGMGAAGRAWALAEASVERMAARYEALYRARAAA